MHNQYKSLCEWIDRVFSRKVRVLVLLIVSLPGLTLAADSGSEAFRSGNYGKAIEYYNRILQDKDVPQAAYNLGNAHYKQGNLEESIKAFEQSLTMQDPAKKAQVMYNLGNALAKSKKLKESLAFYRRALELQPDDLDTKYNLELIRRQLRNQQQQSESNQQSQNQKNNQEKQQGQQRNQEQQNRKPQDQKQNQTEQQQQNRGNQEKEQQSQDPSEKSDQQQQQDRQSQQRADNQKQQQQQGEKQETQQQARAGKKQSLDKEEAAQILNALRINQDKVMKAQIRKKLRQIKTEKDW